MPAIIIQSTKLNDNNNAEKQMLAFLSGLPETYYVYRELKIIPAYFETRYGTEYRQPDFVLVSPQFGIIIIEVKDWNIRTNAYRFKDQMTVTCTSHSTGQTVTPKNPFDQAQKYLFALRDLMKAELRNDLHKRLSISALVAFPSGSRVAFMNEFNPAQRYMQSKHQFDFERTIFSEEIAQYRTTPEALIALYAKRTSPPLNAYEFDTINQTLIPSKFVIGDVQARQKGRTGLRLLSEQQQKGAFDLTNPVGYLLDVAGSGKTNVLVSRAIATVQKKHDDRFPQLLVTTYSRTLADNIRQILNNKLESDSQHRTEILERISILSIPDLLELIYKDFYGQLFGTLPGESSSGYEARLLDEVLDVLATDDRFKRWDGVFIDEIQDFSDDFLRVCKAVSRGNLFFFVGDIGQRIYDREHHLRALGLSEDHISLDKTFRMYRTPRYISQLAVQFINQDASARVEFEKYGYSRDAIYASQIANGAQLLRADDLVADAVACASEYINGGYQPSDMLIISADPLLNPLTDALDAAHIVVRHTNDQPGVRLVNFIDAKGLEGLVVIIVGIEHLPDRSTPALMFAELDARLNHEKRSRRLIYIALTRTIENAIVFYTDPNHRFVSDLLTLNRAINADRQGKK